jgi:hypothetical protein
LFDRDRAGDRLKAELGNHIEAPALEEIATGLSVGEARAVEPCIFGNRGLLREQARATRELEPGRTAGARYPDWLAGTPSKTQRRERMPKF